MNSEPESGNRCIRWRPLHSIVCLSLGLLTVLGIVALFRLPAILEHLGTLYKSIATPRPRQVVTPLQQDDRDGLIVSLEEVERDGLDLILRVRIERDWEGKIVVLSSKPKLSCLFWDEADGAIGTQTADCLVPRSFTSGKTDCCRVEVRITPLTDARSVMVEFGGTRSDRMPFPKGPANR